MTTINTTDDLLSLLNENKEFREAVRRAILTEELLALPATHNAFVSEMREFVSEIRNYTKATDRRLQALEEGQRELKEGQKALEEGQQALEEGQQEIKEGQQGHTNDIGELKGIGLETKLYNRGPSLIATLLKVRANQRVRVAESDNNSEEFNSAIYKAWDEGVINEEEYERIMDTDMIISSLRPGSSNPVYTAIEASYGVSRDDIAKVKETATILSRVFHEAEIHTALYYINITSVIKEEADQQGVHLITDLTQLREIS